MSVESVVKESSPRGYWRHGEASGTEIKDASGNAQKGEYKGSPTLGVAGGLISDPDTAVLLNGTSQYGTVPDSATMDLGDVFTYMALFRRTGTGKTDCLLDKGPNAPIFRFNGEDNLLLRRNNVGDIAKSTIKITDTLWHFAAATKNGATVRIWHATIGPDATLANVTGTVTNQTCTNTTTPLGIGASEVGVAAEDFFRGAIDESAVFNTALSEATLKAILAAVIAGAPRMLV